MYPHPKLPVPHPRRFPPKLRQLPKGKLMTIAAGFVCTDGILLASDSLYSGGPAPTHGHKFWILPEPRQDDSLIVVFGGSGLEIALRRTRDEINRRLSPGKMSRQKVVEAVDSALAYVDKRLKPATTDELTYALVAIRLEGKEELYENAGKCFLSPVDRLTKCVGFGAPLGVFFTRSLFQSSMPIKWAKCLAAHMIKHVKLHATDVGGETYLVEVPSFGEPRFIADQSEIGRLEEHLSFADEAMRLVLPDGTTDDATLEQRLGQVIVSIRTIRNSSWFTPQPGRMSIIGGVPTMTITGPSLPLWESQKKPQDES